MLQERRKFPQAARLDAGEQRHEALVAQIGTQRLIIVLFGAVGSGTAGAGNGQAAVGRVGALFMKKRGNRHIQPTGERHDFFVSGRELPFFDFGKGRHGNIAFAAELLQGQAGFFAQSMHLARQKKAAVFCRRVGVGA